MNDCPDHSEDEQPWMCSCTKRKLDAMQEKAAKAMSDYETASMKAGRIEKELATMTAQRDKLILRLERLELSTDPQRIANLEAANDQHLLERNRYAIERDRARAQLAEAQNRIAELLTTAATVDHYQAMVARLEARAAEMEKTVEKKKWSRG